MKKGSYNCHFIGNVNNPKVVLIHGMGFYWEKCFTPIIEALELEYCLIIPELEGHHNKSEKTDIKIADCVNRLEQELTSNNIKQVDVVYGISFGASIAAEFACNGKIKVNNLILDGAMFVDQGLMSWFSALIMAWQFKRILSDKPMFSYIKKQMGYTTKDEITILKPLMCNPISFQTLRKSAYECYRYDITKKNKIESNVRFIYGSGESFPAQSEEIIAGCTPKLINSKIYDNKGHAEILSCYPEKIVNIIKSILHSKQL